MRRELAEAAAVRPEALGPGAAVRVLTRMGREVAEGLLAYPTARGGCVHGAFYPADLYRFVPLSEGAHARADVLDEAKRKKAPKLGKLDVDRLPEELRAAITTDEALDEEQVQRVLAAVGEACLKALKDVGVSEDTVYARTAAVQLAVRGVLEGDGAHAEDGAEAKAKAKVKAKASGANDDEEE